MSASNLYFDTSALFKLYHHETGTDQIKQLISASNRPRLLISELNETELKSVLYKKSRKREISVKIARELYKRFEGDLPRFRCVPLNRRALLSANALLDLHHRQGLRTLDAIQLAAALSVMDRDLLFISFDKKLNAAASAEGLRLPGFAERTP